MKNIILNTIKYTLGLPLMIFGTLMCIGYIVYNLALNEMEYADYAITDLINIWRPIE